MSLYIILMGVQGAGKGEQAKFIHERYGIPHVSTGDLFRAMKTREDELAKRVQQIMAEGRLVDDATTNEVVKDRLSQPDAQGGVIFDGYPRTPNQAAWLENYLAEMGARIDAVLLLELDLYTAFKRAFGRVSSASGKTYNIYFNRDGLRQANFEDHPEKAYPPRLIAVDAETGETLARRPDDASADAILKRIDTFVATTQPLIDYFDAKNLVKRIPADQSIEAVSAAIEKAIQETK
ncbi:MAG: nucleoside monophosphate kinase [Anaerolinea sp.]|nr:nucleoside monophosphate kinase [Anaerolinea sp.]